MRISKSTFWPIISVMLITASTVGLAGAFEVTTIPFTVEVGDEVIQTLPPEVKIGNAHPYDVFERTFEAKNNSGNTQDVLLELLFEDQNGVSASMSPSRAIKIPPGETELFHATVRVRGDVVPNTTIVGKVVVHRLHVVDDDD